MTTTSVFDENGAQFSGSSPAGSGGPIDSTTYELWSDGQISSSFTADVDGLYTFTVQAFGDDAGTRDPNMEILVDGKPLASGKVTATSESAPGVYSVAANLIAGQHDVEIAFTNDYYSKKAGDVNLYVENVNITRAATPTPTPSPTPTPAPSSSPQFQAAGRSGYLLPAGYLSTSGNQIVDSNGNNVRIASVGWDGADGAPGHAMGGLTSTNYKTEIDALKADGFNTIRIAWSNASLNVVPTSDFVDTKLNPDLAGLTNLGIFDKVVSYAGTTGMKVIFDHHTDDGGPNGWGGQQANGLWIDSGPGTDGTDGSGTKGTVTAAKFQADWVSLAQHYAGNSTVIGFDLDNEPTYLGNPTWGGNGAIDIHAMYQNVGAAVQQADPGALIIAEGIITPNHLDGDLSPVASDPVVLPNANKVVYSVHEYAPDVTGGPSQTPAQQIARMNSSWGYLESKNIAPVWIGEMGSSVTSSQDQQWASTLLNYMNGRDGSQGGPTFGVSSNGQQQQGVSGDWWEAGVITGSSALDGIQSAWGTGNYRTAEQSYTDQMLFDG